MIDNKVAIVWKNGSAKTCERSYLPVVKKMIADIDVQNIAFDTVLSWEEFESKIVEPFVHQKTLPYFKIVLLIELDWASNGQTNQAPTVLGWDLTERMIMDYGIPIPLEIYSFLPLESWQQLYCRQSFYMSCMAVDYHRLPFPHQANQSVAMDWNIFIKHLSKIIDFVLLDQAKNCESNNWHLTSFLDNFSTFNLILTGKSNKPLADPWQIIKGRLVLLCRSLQVVGWLGQNMAKLKLKQSTRTSLHHLLQIEQAILEATEGLLRNYQNP
ncbi:MAG: hypothetical protein AAF985_23270, partial [Bacteroidota bacterium]